MSGRPEGFNPFYHNRGRRRKAGESFSGEAGEGFKYGHPEAGAKSIENRR
jgi:hypothetical protein